MPCYSPLPAYKLAGGGITFSRGGGGRDAARALGAIDIPCGQCLGCRLQRARDMAIRVTHEAQMHDANAFVTLTIDDAHMPADQGLDHRHFQLFMKRLRFHHGKPVRFYMCGEYGETTQRPHYHACLFGVDFSQDRSFFTTNPQGDDVYTSKALDKLWQLGHCTLGAVTLESAGYCTRYIVQKKTGDLGKLTYGDRLPPYNRMSLRPGLGAGWLERFRSDVFPCDYLVTADGHKDRVPRYYDKRNEAHDADKFAAVKLQREESAQDCWEDNTDARLRVKATVKAAAVRQLTRKSI